MTTITIKPHHFIDIIKLYGSGIEKFIPDLKMGHDFYKIANIIIENPDVLLTLTIQVDDICTPCHVCKNHVCVDKLSHIEGYTLKDTYNKVLDTRILELYQLDKNKLYTASDLCTIFYNHHDYIYKVWLEEDDQITLKRHDLFVAGAKKFLVK